MMMHTMLEKLAKDLETDLRRARAHEDIQVRRIEITKALIHYIERVDVVAGAIATDITYSAGVL